MSQVYVLHENDEWVAPLREAFEQQNIEHTFWHLASGAFDLSEAPPQGVFYNRMSASSHTRDHRFAPEYTATLLEWLENHARTVINGSRAIDLEISKARQYAALARAGIRVPKTIVTHNTDVLAQAAKIGFPLIVKPNRGGKGLGVRRVDSREELASLISNDELDAGPDGLLLIQQYVQPADASIIRNEFVGAKHLYSVRVDTSKGFELCPADVCEIERDDASYDASNESTFCPASTSQSNMFEILEGFSPPDVQAYEAVLRDNNIGIAGIEMIIDAKGQAWTYDLNTNTNYNPDAERRAGVAGTIGAGMQAIAAHLGEWLVRVDGQSQQAA